MSRLRLVLPVCALIMLVALAAVGTPQVGEALYINNPGRTDNNPYSNMVVAGDEVYLAGAIGTDPAIGSVPDDVEQEIRFVLDSMKTRLEMVGLTMDDLVSVTVFCPDLTLYGTFNDIYRTYFEEHFPARAFVGSGPLLADGNFEIVGTAVRR